MKKFALIGEKLSHSYSAIIHRRFFELAGLDCEYDLIEIEKENFEKDFLNISQNYSGINVTIPYKKTVIDRLDRMDDISRKIGAVNTVTFSNGEISGTNTDYYGLKLTLLKNNIDLKGKRAVILGTGGASEAVCALCKDEGASDITFVSRKTFENSKYKTITYEDKISGDVLFNATPVGMYPKTDFSPIEPENTDFNCVVDLIYNPSKTLLMKKAEKCGMKAVNGLYMLVSQALYSQSVWQNTPFDENFAEIIYSEMKKCFE